MDWTKSTVLVTGGTGSFGKKFIKAIDVKTRMTVGKEHKLKNGDVIEIVANK